MWWLYLIIGVFVLGIFGISFYIAKSIFKPKKWDYQETKTSEIEKGQFDPEYFKQFDFEEVSIDSFGLKLNAHLYKNKDSLKTIIFMHGHTFSKYGSYKYAKMFLKRGFNVLMPDQRYHGLSEGRNCTLGYKESKDLHHWIDFLYKKIPNNETLGIHGESMGAATVLLGGHHDKVDFVISDCSFCTLKRMTTDALSERHFPKFLVYTAHLVSVLVYQAPLLRVNPMKNVKNIKAPILFIHGHEDKYIKLDHLYKNMKYAKKIDSKYICQKADHAQSFEHDKAAYELQVDKFLNAHNII